VPYDSLDGPEILLSSDTRSGSSLFNEGRKGKAKEVRSVHVNGAARKNDQNTWQKKLP
jgi:hypothetical protein